MSEAEKPKRPWFRFHLSTALVVLLLTGLLVIPVITDVLTRDPVPQIEIVAVILTAMLVAAVGVSMEWLIRRGETRKT